MAATYLNAWMYHDLFKQFISSVIIISDTAINIFAAKSLNTPMTSYLD